MRLPSTSLRSNMREAVGESDFFTGLKKDQQLAQSVKEGMATPFGAALYSALEAVERSAYMEMEKVSPVRIFKQFQLRAELRTARYIKNVLDSYVINAEALARNIEELQGQEENSEWKD